MVELSIVVVTYKTKELVINFLTSVERELEASGLAAKIIVVDNASQDGTVESVRDKFPEAIVIANNENSGPAKAFNLGIQEGIDSKYVLVSNSDIQVLPGTIKVMYEYLEANSDIMGVSGPLLNEDGTLQQTRTQIMGFKSPKWDQPFQVEFVGTTFALIRREAYLQLGGYDENYYFYNEDLDWAERAKRQGLPFMALPEAKVIHFLSKGMVQNRSRIMRELYWSNIYYFKKFYPKISWLVYRILSLEIHFNVAKLKKQLRKLEVNHQQDLEQQMQDLVVAKNRMKKHYTNSLEPKIPFWGQM